MPAKSWLRFRVPLGFLFAGFYLWLSYRYPPRCLFLSTLLIVLGCVLRSWAAGYLLKGKRVAVGGPYAYVRNPLYLGSFLIGAGCCLVLYQNPLPPAVVVFWLVYILGFAGLYIAKSQSEEAELVKALGDAYVAYREKVPVFFPVRGRITGLGTQSFSVELYRKNREYQCIWGCVGLLLWIYGHHFYAF